MKAINTHFDNLYFRSRLEARWAVYFKSLGIEYVYEMEGYNFDGFNYLPDFYFPKYDFYGEVKHKHFGDVDAEKWDRFVTNIKKPLIIFDGTPNAKPLKSLFWERKVLSEYITIPFSDLMKPSFGTFFYAGGYEDFAQFEPYKSAVSKARKARFEHGENQ
jgi:hypothetical protein